MAVTTEIEPQRLGFARLHGHVIRLIALASLLLPLSSAAGAEEPFPPSWRKTMTNDPESNPELKKFAAPLANATQEEARVVVLSRVLAGGCRGAAINRPAWDGYIDRTGLRRLSKTELKTASDMSGMSFDGFDYETLAHLCAGIDYLFGPEGVLARNMVSRGSGEPVGTFDPSNPYLRIAPLVSDTD